MKGQSRQAGRRRQMDFMRTRTRANPITICEAVSGQMKREPSSLSLSCPSHTLFLLTSR
jgi:hypothetical protein